MESLNGALVFLGVMVWLGLGGYSCAKLGKGLRDDLQGTNFLICLVLAPFTAAFAFVADKSEEKPVTKTELTP